MHLEPWLVPSGRAVSSRQQGLEVDLLVLQPPLVCEVRHIRRLRLPHRLEGFQNHPVPVHLRHRPQSLAFSAY